MEEQRAEKNKVRNWTIYGLLVSACLVAYFFMETSQPSSDHESTMSFWPVCCRNSSLQWGGYRYIKRRKTEFWRETERRTRIREFAKTTNWFSRKKRHISCQLHWNHTMSLNASIKKGKEGQESDLRLTSMIGGSNRQKKENMLKKKRTAPSYLDTYNRMTHSNYTKEDVGNICVSLSVGWESYFQHLGYQYESLRCYWECSVLPQNSLEW